MEPGVVFVWNGYYEISEASLKALREGVSSGKASLLLAIKGWSLGAKLGQSRAMKVLVESGLLTSRVSSLASEETYVECE